MIALTEEQLQVILTGKFGDGCLATNHLSKLHPENEYPYYYMTSSVCLEYIQFKKKLLDDLCRRDILCDTNRGYKDNLIFRLTTVSHPQITQIAKESVDKSITRLTDLGVALWLYDDGSLHQKKHFYNLNTQSFSKEVNYDVFVPFFKDRYDITAIPTIERKKDGREFWYLRIRKYDGAFVVSELLSKYPVSGLEYKLIDKSLINKWNILKQDLIRDGVDVNSIHPKTLAARLNRL